MKKNENNIENLRRYVKLNGYLYLIVLLTTIAVGIILAISNKLIR